MRVWWWLTVALVVSWCAFASCGGNECTSGEVSCAGNVMVFCASEERGPPTVHRRPCASGERCTVGYFAGGTPDFPYVWCFADLGSDPRCTNLSGFCSGNQPFVCQDGHLLQAASGPCPQVYTCGFDPGQPGSWPSCLDNGDGGSPRDLCEDLGDAPTACPIWFPPCDDGGMAPCYNAWHIPAGCCDTSAIDGGAGRCGTPFRRIDGSKQERVGGFAGCRAVGMSQPAWCCAESD